MVLDTTHALRWKARDFALRGIDGACRRRTLTTMTTRIKMTKRMTTRKTKSPQSSENRTNSSRAIASNELNAD
jgi:hypothetical protein